MMFEWGKIMGLDSTIEAWLPLQSISFFSSCQQPLHPTYLMTLTLSIIGTKDGNRVHFMHEYRMQCSSPSWQRGWDSPLFLGELSKKIKSTFRLFWGWREVISGPANAEVCFWYCPRQAPWCCTGFPLMEQRGHFKLKSKKNQKHLNYIHRLS